MIMKVDETLNQINDVPENKEKYPDNNITNDHDS